MQTVTHNYLELAAFMKPTNTHSTIHVALNQLGYFQLTPSANAAEPT